MTAQLTLVHALSPLHAGTGQGAGVIDLPIAREKATGIPFLPGSSLKGALKALCPDDYTRKRIFGADPTDTNPGNDYASPVQFSDQRLLLLPVRSLAGTFAWVTSPYVLRRLARFVSNLRDISFSLPTSIPQPPAYDQCYIAGNTSKITFSQGDHQKIVLEDLDLFPQPEDIKDWANWIGLKLFDEVAWQTILTERLCIIHDDLFNFLIDTALEITTRIKLKEDTKTVDTVTGGLWYEEALPTETVLYGFALATPVKAINVTSTDVFNTLTTLTENAVQLGGKATVGRGICQVRLIANETSGVTQV
jgi:CRISPR-associated protein Cmr4